MNVREVIRADESEGPHRRAGRASVVAAVGTFGLVIGCIGAATVYACVPLRSLLTFSPGPSGAAGSSIAMSGHGFPSGALEVRWNSLDGPMVARVDGPDFSVPMRVPEVPGGLYQVLVVSRDASGTVASADSDAFLVLAASEDASSVRQKHQKDANAAARLGTAGAAIVVMAVGVAVGLAISRKSLPTKRERA